MTNPSPTPSLPNARTGWIEVRVDAPQGTEELVAEALRHDEGASAWTDGPADPAPPEGMSAVRAYISARADGEETRAGVCARVAKLASATGLEELTGLRPSFREIPSDDWANAWRATWKPFRVGRLCVVPPWRKEPLRPDDVALRLEPGGVFGTGRHPSTRTCLRELQQLPISGGNLVDAGTGTGILAVAARLLGAQSVFGFDIDPDSEGYANDLARDNGVANADLRFRTGDFDLLSEAERPVDGIMANIYHDVLQARADDLRDTLRPGGWFLFSGIHRRHRQDTRTSVEAAGLQVEKDLRAGSWCTLVGLR